MEMSGISSSVHLCATESKCLLTVDHATGDMDKEADSSGTTPAVRKAFLSSGLQSLLLL